MELFQNVEWSGTRAYSIGLNGLYVNLQGREKDGIVPPAERDLLLSEIAERLEATIDPQTRSPAVSQVYLRDETYTDGGQREIGPDAVIGYWKGTRGADASALGEVGKEVLIDNDKPWSGDHGIDPCLVPGVLFSNRKIDADDPSILDLAPSVLTLFGIEPPKHMEGKPLFRAVESAAT